MHTCSECGFRTETQPRECPQCRANDYLEFRKGVNPATFLPCKDCGARTLLNALSKCKRCMRAQGLKVCKLCDDVVVVGLGISKKKALCKGCDLEVKKERRRKASSRPKSR